jgi:4-hydroxy-tetrahydrodipicolinate reductase
MRIAIVGTGKMGTAVAEQALRAGHDVSARIGGAENAGQRALTPERLAGSDVAIEFSRPDTALPNALRLLELGVPVVTGTTGWYDHLAAVETAVRERNGAFLYGPNFSIGAALFQATAAALAARLARRPELDAAIEEAHHRAKRDAPSGTAVSIRQAVRAADPSREYPITSIRLGSIPGTHRLLVDGPFESIELSHIVRDRAVFAQGAVVAAAWLAGRRGCFHFHDILEGEAR